MFSLTSPVGPAASDHLVRGFDRNPGTTVDNVGTVLTPSAVPEPSELVLGLLAAACVASGGRPAAAPRGADGARWIVIDGLHNCFIRSFLHEFF